MTKSKPMGKELKIYALKKRFHKLNPGVGYDMVDWDAEVGRRERFNESLEDLSKAYPEYRWYTGQVRTNDDAAIRSSKRDLEASGYKVVKRSEYNKILRRVKQQPQRKAKVKRRGKLVKVRKHTRGYPRR